MQILMFNSWPYSVGFSDGFPVDAQLAIGASNVPSAGGGFQAWGGTLLCGVRGWYVPTLGRPGTYEHAIVQCRGGVTHWRFRQAGFGIPIRVCRKGKRSWRATWPYVRKSSVASVRAARCSSNVRTTIGHFERSGECAFEDVQTHEEHPVRTTSGRFVRSDVRTDRRFVRTKMGRFMRTMAFRLWWSRPVAVASVRRPGLW